MAVPPHAVTATLPPDLTTRPCEPNVNRFVFFIFIIIFFLQSGDADLLSHSTRFNLLRLSLSKTPRLPFYPNTTTSWGVSTQECVCVCARACDCVCVCAVSHTTVCLLFRATTFLSTLTAAF